MKRLFFLLFTVSSLIFPGADIYIDLERDTVLVGDKIPLIITVRTLEDLKFQFPKIERDNKKLTISTTSLTDTSIVLSLQFWEVGNHIFPAIDINFTNENSHSSKLKTNPINFTVLERFKELNHALKKSKANRIIHLPFTIYRFMLMLALVLSLLLVYFILRKQKQQDLIKDSFRGLDFYNYAITELDNLELPQTIDSKGLEAFYISLTNIIKDYLLAKFYFNANKMTTAEILDYLRFRNIPINGLDSLLKDADLCKFAKKKYGATALVKVKKTAQSILTDLENISI